MGVTCCRVGGLRSLDAFLGTNTTPFLAAFITHIIYGIACSDHPQNLINCYLYYCLAILKISSKSVKNFLSNIANRQINKQTNKMKTLPPWRR